MKLLPASIRSRASAIGTLAVAMLLTAAAGSAAQATGPRITPNFKDADITQLIEAVCAATG